MAADHWVILFRPTTARFYHNMIHFLIRSDVAYSMTSYCRGITNPIPPRMWLELLRRHARRRLTTDCITSQQSLYFPNVFLKFHVAKKAQGVINIWSGLRITPSELQPVVKRVNSVELTAPHSPPN